LAFAPATHLKVMGVFFLEEMNQKGGKSSMYALAILVIDSLFLNLFGGRFFYVLTVTCYCSAPLITPISVYTVYKLFKDSPET